MLQSIEELGHNTFLVVSLTSEDVKYMVDMTSGMCECPSGMNGSACKHLYVIWANNMASQTPHFLPVFSKEERKKISELAVGSSLPISYYEGLHERVLNSPPDDVFVATEQQETPEFDEYEISRLPTPLTRRNKTIDLITREECIENLKLTFEFLCDSAKTEDQHFCRGILKFCDRTRKMSTGRLSSCLHTFGSTQVTSLRNTASSIVSKAKRGKIHVQPEAVKRRKTQSGSRNKQSKGQIARNNPFQLAAGQRKRLHQFSENVRKNESVAKKAGRSMSTRHYANSKDIKIARLKHESS